MVVVINNTLVSELSCSVFLALVVVATDLVVAEVHMEEALVVGSGVEAASEVEEEKIWVPEHPLESPTGT